VCDRFVGANAFPLAVLLLWLCMLQPDRKSPGQRCEDGSRRFRAARLSASSQPDRHHLSCVIAKMILVTYKSDVHPLEAHFTKNVTAASQNEDQKVA
jgi:hypothetical protein